MMMIKSLYLFLIVYNCAVIVVVNCQTMELQIKNELPAPPADAPPEDSTLQVRCRRAFLTDPGIPIKIPLHKTQIYLYPEHVSIKCWCVWKRQRQDFMVSGEDKRSGPCPTQPGGGQLCKWEARGDGLYFYTANFVWKKIHSWEKWMI